MALFRKANKNYANLPLKELQKKYKEMNQKKKQKYTRQAAHAFKFQDKLLGAGPMGPLYKKPRAILLSIAPARLNKDLRKRTTQLLTNKGGSLPNRLRPKPDMRHKHAKRAKAYGYVNAQNNMVLLGQKMINKYYNDKNNKKIKPKKLNYIIKSKKFDPYGVWKRNSL